MVDNLKLPANFLFVASPFMGKTTTKKYLLTTFALKGKFDRGIVITDTVEDYADIVPREYIHQFYDESLLDKLMQLQIVHAKPNLPETDPNKYPPAFVIFDDCVGFNFNSSFTPIADTRTSLYSYLLKTSSHYVIQRFTSALVIHSSFIKLMLTTLGPSLNTIQAGYGPATNRYKSQL